MKPKETSPRISSLVARIFRGYHPTREEILSMCGSLLSQDQTRGQKPDSTEKDKS